MKTTIPNIFALSTVICATVALIGCGSISTSNSSTTPTPEQPAPVPLPAVAEMDLTVLANQGTSTGLAIKRGQVVTVKANGADRWLTNPNNAGTWVGAGGGGHLAEFDAHPAYTVPGSAEGSLVEYLAGVPPQVFHRNDDELKLTAGADGTLTFGPNDNVLTDNQGFIRVHITVRKE